MKKDARQIIQLIVENNPADVKQRIKNRLGLNAIKWGDSETIDYLFNLFKQGYDISWALKDVIIMRTSPNFKEFAKWVDSLDESDGLQQVAIARESRALVNRESVSDNPNAKSVWEYVAGIGAGILGGSILGTVLFPQESNSNLPQPPTSTNTEGNNNQNGGEGKKTFWQKVKTFYAEHPFISWGGTIAVVGVLFYVVYLLVKPAKKAE